MKLLIKSTVLLLFIAVVVVLFSQGCGPQFVSDNGNMKVSESSALYWVIWFVGTAILFYLLRYFWVILVVFIILLVSLSLGSSFLHVLLYIAVAVILHITDVLLTRMYITAWMQSENLPLEMMSDTWEATAGLGIVPKWVSFIGLIALGFFLSGVLLTILLLAGVIDRV